MKKPSLLLLILAILITFFFLWYTIFHAEENRPQLAGLEADPGNTYYYEMKLPHETLRFNLVDPEQAPESIRQKALLGWKLMHQTQIYAKEYVGNSLNCNNCHFGCGNTFGGKNGSISLVGSTVWYPEYSQRFQREFTLEERIENCFKRSLNGHPPPKDSEIMQAYLAYLSWISNEVSGLRDLPWRGLIPLKSKHVPDANNGRLVYQKTCAPCHQPNGEGMEKEDATLNIPPVWGPNSYNAGAGMNTLQRLSSFVYYNMPYQQPSLTEEEALDVSAFLIEQPRPEFKEDHSQSKNTSSSG